MGGSRNNVFLFIGIFFLAFSFFAFFFNLSMTGFAVSDSQSSSTGEWVSRGRTLNGSVYYPGEINITRFGIMWNASATADIGVTPAIKDGVAYFGSYDFNVYAINITDGSQIWNYTTPSTITNSPSVSDGLVFISSSSYFYALYTENGSQAWNYTFTGSSTRSSSIVADDMVYFGTTGDLVYALNATNGSMVWSYTTGNDIYSSPMYENGIIYVGSRDYSFYALNATNGSQIWNYTTGAGIWGSSAYANGAVYFGSDDNYVYALNATNGSQIWNYSGSYDFNEVSYRNGVVYTGNDGGEVLAIYANNGSQIWNYTASNGILSSPTITSNDLLFVNAFDGKFYIFGATNGSLIWNYTLGQGALGGVAIVDGVAYLGSNTDLLYAFKHGYQDPALTISKVTPSGNLSIPKYSFRPIVLNVTCLYNDCGLVNVTLDPAVYSGSVYSVSDPYIDDPSLPTSGYSGYFVKFTAGVEDGNCFEILSHSASCWNGFPCLELDSSFDSGVSSYEVWATESECTGIPLKGGTISTTPGTIPFYTNMSSNPYTINLSNGESQLVTFWVNATSNVTHSFNFLAYANRTEVMSTFAVTPSWNVTIVENTPPQVEIFSPNTSIYSSSSIYFEFRTDENSTCNYTLDSGSTFNTTLANSSDTGFNSTNVLSDGDYNVEAYCYDIYENLNSSVNFSFGVDTTSPSIEIIFPTTEITSNASQMNYTYSDNHSDSCWYSIDGGTTNSSSVSAGTNFTGISYSQGVNNFTLYCNDTAGNENATNVTFSVDSVAPLLEIVFPTNDTTSSVSELNYTYSDDNSGYCWYSINSGSTNSSSVSVGTNFTSVSSSEGTNVWIVYCNDTAGNINLTNVTFTIPSTTSEVVSSGSSNSGGSGGLITSTEDSGEEEEVIDNVQDVDETDDELAEEELDKEITMNELERFFSEHSMKTALKNFWNELTAQSVAETVKEVSLTVIFLSILMLSYMTIRRYVRFRNEVGGYEHNTQKLSEMKEGSKSRGGINSLIDRGALALVGATSHHKEDIISPEEEKVSDRKIPKKTFSQRLKYDFRSVEEKIKDTKNKLRRKSFD